MRMRAIYLLIPALLAGCSAVETKQIDQKKYEPLVLIGKEVEADLATNVIPRKEVLRRLKAEASMAESRASSEAERSMVRFYADAASMFMFAETLRESELATVKSSSPDESKSSARFRQIGLEKLRAAQQTYLGK